MKVVFATEQVHGKKQSRQAEVMIAMQMADEDVIDFMLTDVISPELVLTPFAAIDEELLVVNDQVLR